MNGKGGLLPVNTTEAKAAAGGGGGGWRRRHPLHEKAAAAFSSGEVSSSSLPPSPKQRKQQQQNDDHKRRRKRVLARAFLLLVVALLLWYLRAVAETYRERDEAAGGGGKRRRAPRTTTTTSSASSVTSTSTKPGRNGKAFTAASSSSSDDRISCISWRQTHHCSPDGERDRAHDKGCEYRIRRDSGYCECTRGLTTKRVSCGRHGGFTCDDECDRLNSEPELARPFPSNVSCPSTSTSASGLSGDGDGDGNGDGGSGAASSSSSSPLSAVGPNTNPARAAAAEEASAAARETAIAGGWWHLRVTSGGKGGGGGGNGKGKEENGDNSEERDENENGSDEAQIVVAADTAAGQEADASSAALWSSLSDSFAVAKRAAAEAEGARLAGRRRRRRRSGGGGGRGGGDGGGDGELEGENEDGNSDLDLDLDVLLIPERRTDGRDWSIDGVRLPPAVVKAALAGQRAFLESLPAYPGGGGGGGEKKKNESSSSHSPAPPPLFSGRGVVFLGGGPTYLVPTLVALRSLRLGGCALPAEVWFPRAEAPTAGLEKLLAELGAVARLLPGAARTVEGAVGAKAGGAGGAAVAVVAGRGKKKEKGKEGASSSTSSTSSSSSTSAEEEEDPSATAVLGPSLGPAGGDGDLSGFTMKAAALLLSRFEEVLFLDSDNVAVLNPEALFDSKEFKESGAILWPDYWESTAARDAAAALGLSDDEVEEGGKEKSSDNDDNDNALSSSFSSSSSSSFQLRGSHESGQMLFDKRRAWPALALAAYFNHVPGFYYEILGCFMGKGDKETFAAALAATRSRFHKIETPVGSVGLPGLTRRCLGGQRWCWRGYAGNTMTQHDTHGRVMFLHTNLSPKWNLRIPAESKDLKRRWEVLQPGDLPFRQALSFSSSSDDPPVDLEGEVFDYLSSLSCDPSLQRYAEEMAARANALRSLEEARERREDKELELVEAAEEGEEEEEEALSLRKKGGRKQQQQQQKQLKESKKPLWRVEAERRRVARLEEEKRREKELRRLRKKAAAAASAKKSKRRRNGEEDEEEEEDKTLDDNDLFLFDKPRPPITAADLLPRGLAPNSFHPLNPGVDFAAAFRWGLRGTFEGFTPLSNFDWLLHWVNGSVRPSWRWARRGVAFAARGGGGYFRPF